MATKPRKNPHAVALGRKGGTARAASLTPEQLRAIGKLGGRPKGSGKKPTKS
jgi:general stress protein YciG